MTQKNIGVIGAGAWGTALAILMTRSDHNTQLWAYEADLVSQINQTHENPLYLPGVTLPHALTATNDMATLADSDLILMVGPAQHMRRLITDFAPCQLFYQGQALPVMSPKVCRLRLHWRVRTQCAGLN